MLPILLNNLIKIRLRFIKKDNLLNHLHNAAISYKVPANLSYAWNFGFLALFCLILQLLTGIFLAMHYVPTPELAFASIEHIMRDVNFGSTIRYTHANGASMFFLVVYMHIIRGMFFGSYVYPREKVWMSGVVILLIMILTAFMGYVLPWGQMSFWAATVITNLASAIPYIGDSIVTWLWGGYSVGGPTLGRFFSLHYLFPFILTGLILLHILFLREAKSNNPSGNRLPDFLQFWPYFGAKDFHGLIIFIMVFAFFISFAPNYLGHTDNYIKANPLVTPAHIVPEWYFLPFYAILRSVPDKGFGVFLLLAAILILILLPLYHQPQFRSEAFHEFHKVGFIIFIYNCFVLGWIGGCSIEYPFFFLGQCSTILYFFYLIIYIPVIAWLDILFWENRKNVKL